MRNGIIASGCLILDNIKRVDYYPNKGMMCKIVEDIIHSVGGGTHNVLVTLAKMNVDVPLEVLGCVGKDEGGDKIINAFELNGIRTDLIQRVDKNTSFTDVIVEVTTGDRTFMHYTGANAELDFPHFEKAKLSNAKIFLLGVLRLQKLDSADGEFGIGYAKVLSYLTSLGFKTAVDLVSIKSDLFGQIFQHCMKHIDYLIINEIEAQSLTGLIIREHATDPVNFENLEKSAEMLLKQGVRELVVIHIPDGCFVIDKGFNKYKGDCYKVDKGDIVSSVGCGDAFNAGVLYSLHEGFEIPMALKIGCACARFCLFHNTTTGGAVSFSEIKKFIDSQN
jgi:sugar/nucleoside kinase (ribokinase family)